MAHTCLTPGARIKKEYTTGLLIVSTGLRRLEQYAGFESVVEYFLGLESLEFFFEATVTGSFAFSKVMPLGNIKLPCQP